MLIIYREALGEPFYSIRRSELTMKGLKIRIPESDVISRPMSTSLVSRQTRNGQRNLPRALKSGTIGKA